MKSLWPSAPEFSADAFADQPVWLIQQALEHGRRIRFEALHYQELLPSEFLAAFLNTKRDPKKSQAFKATDFQRFRKLIEQYEPGDISPVAASTIWALIVERRYPTWMYELTPIDQVKSAKSESKDAIANPRLWLSGKGVGLIVPEARNGRVYAEFALIGDDVEAGVVELYDESRQFAAAIKIPESDGQPQAMVNAEFDEVATFRNLEAMGWIMAK